MQSDSTTPGATDSKFPPEQVGIKGWTYSKSTDENTITLSKDSPTITYTITVPPESEPHKRNILTSILEKLQAEQNPLFMLTEFSKTTQLDYSIQFGSNEKNITYVIQRGNSSFTTNLSSDSQHVTPGAEAEKDLTIPFQVKNSRPEEFIDPTKFITALGLPASCPRAQAIEIYNIIKDKLPENIKSRITSQEKLDAEQKLTDFLNGCYSYPATKKISKESTQKESTQNNKLVIQVGDVVYTFNSPPTPGSESFKHIANMLADSAAKGIILYDLGQQTQPFSATLYGATFSFSQSNQITITQTQQTQQTQTITYDISTPNTTSFPFVVHKYKETETETEYLIDIKKLADHLRIPLPTDKQQITQILGMMTLGPSVLRSISVSLQPENQAATTKKYDKSDIIKRLQTGTTSLQDALGLSGAIKNFRIKQLAAQKKLKETQANSSTATATETASLQATNEQLENDIGKLREIQDEIDLKIQPSQNENSPGNISLDGILKAEKAYNDDILEVLYRNLKLEEKQAADSSATTSQFRNMPLLAGIGGVKLKAVPTNENVNTSQSSEMPKYSLSIKSTTDASDTITSLLNTHHTSFINYLNKLKFLPIDEDSLKQLESFTSKFSTYNQSTEQFELSAATKKAAIEALLSESQTDSVTPIEKFIDDCYLKNLNELIQPILHLIIDALNKFHEDSSKFEQVTATLKKFGLNDQQQIRLLSHIVGSDISNGKLSNNLNTAIEKFIKAERDKFKLEISSITKPASGIKKIRKQVITELNNTATQTEQDINTCAIELLKSSAICADPAARAFFYFLMGNETELKKLYTNNNISDQNTNGALNSAEFEKILQACFVYNKKTKDAIEQFLKSNKDFVQNIHTCHSQVKFLFSEKVLNPPPANDDKDKKKEQGEKKNVKKDEKIEALNKQLQERLSKPKDNVNDLTRKIMLLLHSSLPEERVPTIQSELQKVMPTLSSDNLGSLPDEINTKIPKDNSEKLLMLINYLENFDPRLFIIESGNPEQSSHPAAILFKQLQDADKLSDITITAEQIQSLIKHRMYHKNNTGEKIFSLNSIFELCKKMKRQNETSSVDVDQEFLFTQFKEVIKEQKLNNFDQKLVYEAIRYFDTLPAGRVSSNSDNNDEWFENLFTLIKQKEEARKAKDQKNAAKKAPHGATAGDLAEASKNLRSASDQSTQAARQSKIQNPPQQRYNTDFLQAYIEQSTLKASFFRVKAKQNIEKKLPTVTEQNMLINFYLQKMDSNYTSTHTNSDEQKLYDTLISKGHESDLKTVLDQYLGFNRYTKDLTKNDKEKIAGVRSTLISILKNRSPVVSEEDIKSLREFFGILHEKLSDKQSSANRSGSVITLNDTDKSFLILFGKLSKASSANDITNEVQELLLSKFKTGLQAVQEEYDRLIPKAQGASSAPEPGNNNQHSTDVQYSCIEDHIFSEYDKSEQSSKIDYSTYATPPSFKAPELAPAATPASTSQASTAAATVVPPPIPTPQQQAIIEPTPIIIAPTTTVAAAATKAVTPEVTPTTMLTKRIESLLKAINAESNPNILLNDLFHQNKISSDKK